MDRKLMEYKYLWDGSSPQWGLVNDGSLLEPIYSIVNRIDNLFLIIEEDEIYDKVIQKMLDENVSIWK